MRWVSPFSMDATESSPPTMYATRDPSGEMATWSMVLTVGKESMAEATRSWAEAVNAKHSKAAKIQSGFMAVEVYTSWLVSHRESTFVHSSNRFASESIDLGRNDIMVCLSTKPRN